MTGYALTALTRGSTLRAGRESRVADQPVAIVTAAGRGIGAACARALHAKGYRLALMSPSERSVELARELGGIGFSGSVTEQVDIDRLVAAALETFGRIDAVVNNTGYEKYSVVEGSFGTAFNWEAETDPLDVPDDYWHEALDLFLLNVVRMARAVTPVMQRQGGGAMVNISAICAQLPMLDYPMSSTIRTVLSSFVKLYTDMYARDGIRMNNLLLGYVANLDYPDEAYRTIPMGRAASLDEIARNCIAYLGEDASYIAGENLFVDGGVNRSL